ncbi:hypothetical protein [Stenotrophomonas sp. ZAC14D2_NAIMI4_6]|uniref:hypothetical protein n=1 Tax=Stenotrophomonas sp. ZAC14D2_NAIMI4_6 TaxID=2072406 RepID=UPI000D5409EF|nr:hypothetical protein [Stenotrophomonas sp. ZAC14D2_NAIMI4_6]AWH23124.1 hypothetical protein C1933_18780 [Stenotrophomonas sp. ZAC14D2_NAIMI4_6]
MDRSAPLFRRVNARARNSRHGEHGGEYRNERHRKGTLASEATRGSMHGGHRHGRDYTPLFRFLLSKVGQPWVQVHSEACARLDTPEPITWIVATDNAPRRDQVRVGEASYFSGLYVDEAGLLQRVAPALTAKDMVPSCTCCTHTFNGVRFGEDDAG